MRQILRFVLACASIGLGFVQPVVPQDFEDRRVTYIEVAPSAILESAELLRAYATSSLEAPGNQLLRVLQRIGRANHFVLLEAWGDTEAQTAHAESDYAAQFHTALEPLLLSPPDTRLHNDLFTAVATNVGPDGMFVVTHVDVLPPYTDTAVGLLGALVSSGRSEAGNARFDVWTIIGQRNHMTVIEAWENSNYRDLHATSSHTRAFRTSLSPLNGALYDERLYRAL
jgi:quinol monooxygenase YgiN